MKLSLKNITILISLLLTGCRKFEYQNTVDLRTIDSYSDLVQATTGARADFAEIFTDNEVRNAYIYPCSFGDDVTIYSTKIFGCKNCKQIVGINIYNNYDDFQTFDQWGDTIYLNYGCYLQNGFINWKSDFRQIKYTYYKNSYKAIVSLNNIIRQFPDFSVLDESTCRLLGEVYFMRAYAYYRLTRIFGNIPLILDSEVNYTAPRASFNEIYGQIVEDLKKSITLLPATPAKKRISTICPDRGSAKALLAEVYLTMGGFPLHDAAKYALAAKYAREVIDSASVYGFGLLEDFADLYSNAFVTNKEIVSAVQYKSDIDSAIIMDPQIRPTLTSNQLGTPEMTVFARPKFLNNCPWNYRKVITYNLEQTTSFIDTTRYTMVDCTFVPRKITSCYKVPLKKMVSMDWNSYFDNTQGYTIYILRYAHTLLTYAEASARSGNLNSMSYEAVNEVRRRANKVDIHSPSMYDMTEGLSPQQFADSVVWERAWEFTNDAECRWFDLLRLDMLDTLSDLLDQYDTTTTQGMVNENHFFPIPKQDILLDPNLGPN